MNSVAVPDDDLARCVDAARRGSARDCEALYRRFLPWVHGLLLARHRPAIADELTQECFALAFQRLHQLREPRHFAAWIGTIARHLRATEATHDFDALHEESEIPDPCAGPDDHAEAQRLLAAIRALPEAYRETLALRLVEGLSGPEIARLTGLTPDSVRVNLHRGMQKLREHVAPAAKEHRHARTS